MRSIHPAVSERGLSGRDPPQGRGPDHVGEGVAIVYWVTEKSLCCRAVSTRWEPTVQHAGEKLFTRTCLTEGILPQNHLREAAVQHPVLLVKINTCQLAREKYLKEPRFIYAEQAIKYMNLELRGSKLITGTGSKSCHPGVLHMSTHTCIWLYNLFFCKHMLWTSFHVNIYRSVSTFFILGSINVLVLYKWFPVG